MDRLVDAVALALAIGNTAETGTGKQTNATGDDTGLVGDDVTKQVASDNDTVEESGLLDHDHGSAVNELMLNSEVGELVGKSLSHDLAPETAGGEDIGLVKRPDLLITTTTGQETGQTSNTLDLGAGVGLLVPGLAAAIILLALAKVDATGQLADDDEVGALADGGLEGGVLDEGVGGEEARAQVSVCAHLLADLEEALLRANGSGSPFGTSDGTEEDGVGGLGGLKSLVCERSTVGIDGDLRIAAVLG